MAGSRSVLSVSSLAPPCGGTTAELLHALDCYGSVAILCLRREFVECLSYEGLKPLIKYNNNYSILSPRGLLWGYSDATQFPGRKQPVVDCMLSYLNNPYIWFLEREEVPCRAVVQDLPEQSPQLGMWDCILRKMLQLMATVTFWLLSPKRELLLSLLGIILGILPKNTVKSSSKSCLRMSLSHMHAHIHRKIMKTSVG